MFASCPSTEVALAHKKLLKDTRPQRTSPGQLSEHSFRTKADSCKGSHSGKLTLASSAVEKFETRRGPKSSHFLDGNHKPRYALKIHKHVVGAPLLLYPVGQLPHAPVVQPPHNSPVLFYTACRKAGICVSREKQGIGFPSQPASDVSSLAPTAFKPAPVAFTSVPATFTLVLATFYTLYLEGQCGRLSSGASSQKTKFSRQDVSAVAFGPHDTQSRRRVIGIADRSG